MTSSSKSWRSASYRRSRRSGVALIITLALLSVLVIVLVSFVSLTQLDSSATASYSKSMSADQLAKSSLNLVVAQLQQSMSKDAPADIGPAKQYPPVFTNITSANILPPGNVTNADIPVLVNMSSPTFPLFTGTVATSPLQGSSSSTTTTSANGRSVSKVRWGQSYFGTYSSNDPAPTWIVTTRNGIASAANSVFGSTGTTLNNSSANNTNYAVGRFAYAIYNEGGLLDITAAGYPNGLNLTSTQMDAIKGTLAGADLSQISGISTDPQKGLTVWRNPSTGSGTSNGGVYTNSLLGYPLTNAAGSVYPGDNTFISRQDLINAALNNQAGLSTNALPNLTTFTRELNQPSWAPTTPAGSSINYATQATSTTTTLANRLVPFVRVTNASANNPLYHDNFVGAPLTDPIKIGDPVVRRRFSLARLAWLTYKGPSADLPASDPLYNPAGTDAAIKACFGLHWGPAVDNVNYPVQLWQYWGSKSAEAISIETLGQVAAENPSREPNFFELLQAGILSGSLATDAQPSYAGASIIYPDTWQGMSMLQIMRIGANIICQYNTDCYPRLIEYKVLVSTSTNTLVAAGIQNLPYLNMFKDISGLSPDDSTPTTGSPTAWPLHTGANFHYAALYYLFGLWNPHQQNLNVIYNRPSVQLVVETNPLGGYVGFGSGWASGASGSGGAYSHLNADFDSKSNLGYGYTSPLPAAILTLSTSPSQGVNNFLNPGLLTFSDIVSATPLFPGTGGTVQTTVSNKDSGWTTLPTAAIIPGTVPSNVPSNFEAYRMPDLYLDLNRQTPPPPPGNQTDNLTPVYQGFQVILKYKDPNNSNYVPYDFLAGLAEPNSWQQAQVLDWNTQFNPQPTYVAPGKTGSYPVPAISATFLSGGSPLLIRSDPRTFRFNPSWFTRDSQKPGYVCTLAPIDSLWSGATAANVGSYYQTAGYGGFDEYLTPHAPANSGEQVMQILPDSSSFDNAYFPASLCRNNATPGSTTATGYVDTDGVQRMGDNGFYTGGPSTGNPYYDPNLTPSSTTGQARQSDRPIILNHPFNHVADLGYAFRDDPWRSLDFFSSLNGKSTSGDSGLLDLFCVREEPTVVAGRVDLNTQNPLVLQSILSQTVDDVTGNTLGGGTTTNVPMSAAVATAIAQKLAAFTQATPLANKDQLVTQFGPTLKTTDFSSTDEAQVKATREAYVRTLGDVGQTRTWNLMIDLVAQSGRYAASANSLDQFTVEGERRYWLHVAIDRFTGKVIDQKIESVSE